MPRHASERYDGVVLFDDAYYEARIRRLKVLIIVLFIGVLFTTVSVFVIIRRHIRESVPKRAEAAHVLVAKPA